MNTANPKFGCLSRKPRSPLRHNGRVGGINPVPLHLSEFCCRRAGAPPPPRGLTVSLSWALRNGVARAHHLGRTGASPTETSPLSKGGRGRAIRRARARGQRWIGLIIFGFLSTLLAFLVLLSFPWALSLYLGTEIH
ncbi:hypothetical protein PIB30_009794 [Stylosanthes scabra]|uniref:Uncharacterized protein n=1 Tax=Stylosanthes scabra TaxID=79078 RepID=A0ABU6Y3E9_9FABA|nr:hypothetical protein [Stylosanthes scabra]